MGCFDGHPVSTFQVLIPSIRKINLTCDVTFLIKSYCEYHNLSDPVFVLVGFEGTDDKNNDESTLINKIYNYNNYNVVINDLESNSMEENFFEQDFNEDV